MLPFMLTTCHQFRWRALVWCRIKYSPSSKLIVLGYTAVKSYSAFSISKLSASFSRLSPMVGSAVPDGVTSPILPHIRHDLFCANFNLHPAREKWDSEKKSIEVLTHLPHPARHTSVGLLHITRSTVTTRPCSLEVPHTL
uniref:(northern house mosquito) hypothetical protein n=1 Tax=Culex pipiens TaxID=7175 RepID=A0A8D8CMY1_CULPI